MAEPNPDTPFEFPEGATPAAPGEEIVLQLNPGLWYGWILLVFLGPVGVIGGALIFAGMFAEGRHHIPPAMALTFGPAGLLMGLVCLLGWPWYCRTFRLTVTTRRVIRERPGRPEKTRVVEFGPTFAILIHNLGVPGFTQLTFRSGKHWMIVMGLPLATQIAHTAAALNAIHAKAHAPVGDAAGCGSCEKIRRISTGYGGEKRR